MRWLAYGALWMFVFSVPWQNLVVIPGIGVVSKLTGMLTMGLALLAVAVSGRLRRWHLFHVAALLFVLWIAAVLMVIYNSPELPNKFWTFVQLFLAVWAMWELSPSVRSQLGLLSAYVFGAYVAAFGTIGLFWRQGEAMRRFAAGGGDANELAMILALALPMAWYLGMTSRRPLLRWAYRAYLPVGLVALGLTGSRGGMLTSVVALMIVPLTMARLSAGRRAVAITLLVISGAVAATFVPDTLIQRLATTGTEVTGEGGLSGRYRIWRAGLKAFAQKPVVGWGTSSFRGATSPWMGTQPKVAHNSFLSVLVEEGIIGFVLFMTMFWAVLLAVLRLPQLERRFALVLLAALLVAMMPLTWEDRKSVWVILAILVGLSQAYLAATGRGAGQTHRGQAAPVVRAPMPMQPREALIAPGRRVNRDATYDA